jgi:hypothetical protein
MKIVVNGLVAFTLFGLVAATGLQAAEKSNEKKTPKAGESFSGTGTVIKNNVDICMVTGLRWALHPEAAEDVKIYPKTKHATDVLDQAAKNNSTVRVSGTWKETVQCHYVETSRVTIVKK